MTQIIEVNAFIGTKPLLITIKILFKNIQLFIPPVKLPTEKLSQADGFIY